MASAKAANALFAAQNLPASDAADIGASTLLSDGRIVWAFGDTLRTGQTPGIVANSMLVSGGHCASQLMPAEDGPVIPDVGPHTVYWPMSALSWADGDRDRLVVLCSRIRRGTSGDGLDFTFLGTSAAVFGVRPGGVPHRPQHLGRGLFDLGEVVVPLAHLDPQLGVGPPGHLGGGALLGAAPIQLAVQPDQRLQRVGGQASPRPYGRQTQGGVAGTGLQMRQLDLQTRAPAGRLDPQQITQRYAERSRDRLQERQTGLSSTVLDHRELGRGPADRGTQAAVLAYLSDMTLLDTSTFAHGRATFDRDIQAASLDHAMWFHRSHPLDDWILYTQGSPSTQGSRGFTRGSLFARDGTLIASVAQEGLIRLRD